MNMSSLGESSENVDILGFFLNVIFLRVRFKWVLSVNNLRMKIFIVEPEKGEVAVKVINGISLGLVLNLDRIGVVCNVQLVSGWVMGLVHCLID